jgi:predicted peptidase
MRLFLTTLLLASALHAAPTTYPPRAWTSADGKSKFEGNLIEFSDKEVRIRRSADFNQFKVPLDRLSAEDQAYIRGLLREQRRDASFKEGAYADKITGQFTKGVSKQGMNYQLWGNPKLDATKRYPLIIWLHGAGQSGDDNEAQMGGAPKNWVSEAAQGKNACFMLAPQCPSRDIGWKNEVAEKLLALIADLTDNLPIDDARLYLTGSSMGGSGTWYIAAKYPQVFAAAVPLCGGGDTKNAEILKTIPFWVFHGDKDDMVPVDRSRTMVAAVKAAGGELINYSELAGEGHGITGVVYPREDLYEWLFKQVKKGPATTSN